MSLSKGASAAGQSGCTSGDCWYYNVDVAWFNPGTYQLTTYCEGEYFRTASITVGGDGRGAFRGSYSAGGGFCGYAGRLGDGQRRRERASELELGTGHVTWQ